MATGLYIFVMNNDVMFTGGGRRQSSLDSAGEEENISDETITPRTRRNSGSLKRTPPVKSTPSRQSLLRPSSRTQSTVDSEDDDDIMF